MEIIGNGWDQVLCKEYEKPYFQKLKSFVEDAYRTTTVYPPRESLFAALSLTPPEEVRVVILGQDPYHEPGQAMGLAFSVPEGVKIPPSLVNIYKEMQEDLGCEVPDSGDLTYLAKQGTLLLTVLTVQEHAAGSHRRKGWEQFTDAIIRYLGQREDPVVFLLWGKPAEEKASLITYPGHLVLTAPHPSPLSAYRGFFGSRPFSRANAFLQSHGREEIGWSARNIRN